MSFLKIIPKNWLWVYKKYDLDTSGQSGSDSDGTSSTTDKEGEDDEDVNSFVPYTFVPYERYWTL